MIRDANLSDAEAIVDIYNYYVLNSIATFEEVSMSKSTMEEKMKSTLNSYPWLVFVKDDVVMGYAYASAWITRSAYRHTAEVTVYLNHHEVGNGVGTALYETLLDRLKDMNMHCIIGGVSLPNEASVKLHEKFGFEKTAHFKEVGYKFNNWVDVGYWELLLH